MVSQTGTRVARPTSCKEPNLSWKRAKRKCCGQQALFGTKFLKFDPKRANLTTLHTSLRSGLPYLVADMSSVSSIFIAQGYLRSNVQNRHPFYRLPVHSHWQSNCDQSLGTSVSFLWRNSTLMAV